MTKVDLNIALKSPFAKRYENYIGGEWRAPNAGRYFDNVSPITGQPVCEIARSDTSDVEAALDAAHAAKDAWGRTSPAERAVILNKIADRMEANLEMLATAETWDNGKPIRETMAADLPLAIDHFRYFAGAIRAQEGSLSEIDHDTVAYHFHEPLGVVGQIIPWNFPILMAVWKLSPALAAGNCVVLKPAEQTPASIMVLMELIGDLLPKGVPCRERLWPGSGQAARVEQPHRQNCVHRRDDDRPAHHAIRVRQHYPGDVGTRRQIAQHLLFGRSQ
jgi:aldehyde dehydrogenase